MGQLKELGYISRQLPNLGNYLRNENVKKVVFIGHDIFMVIYDGKPYPIYSLALALNLDGSAISRVYVLMNPDKLQGAFRLIERQS